MTRLKKSIHEIEEKYIEKKVIAAVIATELETYFGGLHKKWDDFYWETVSELIGETKKDLKDAQNQNFQLNNSRANAWSNR